MINNKNSLRSLGLSEHEITVYTTLLRKQQSKISDISMETQIHRPSIYAALKSLESKGLVSHTPKGKRKLYNAENPEQLETLKIQLDSNVNSAIEELKEIRQAQSYNVSARFIEGREGIRGIFSDILNSLDTGGIFYRYTSSIDKKKGKSYWPPNYGTIRNKKKIERFVIAHRDYAEHYLPDMNRAVKLLPKNTEKFDYNVVEFIYANKIAFIDYTTETATIIENEKMAKFSRQLFKAFYSLLDSN